jgi:hypothetical protein
MFGMVQSFQKDSDVSDIARIQSLTSHREISALCPRRRPTVNVAKTASVLHLFDHRPQLLLVDDESRLPSWAHPKLALLVESIANL